MLDPVLLRSFVAVERAGGFTAAGRQLGLRQSTVSGHVARLEKSVGRELFRRDTRNLELTADGAAMLGFARTVLDVSQQAQAYFAEAELSGRLRFGASDDLVAAELPEVLLDFRRSHPRIDLELTVGLSETLGAKVSAGELDLAFGMRRPGERHGELVWRDALVWAGPRGADAPDLSQGPVPLVTYPPPSITRRAAMEAMERAGLVWRTTCVTDSLLGLRAAVLAGLGYVVHAESLLPGGLAPLPGHVLPDPGDADFVLMRRPRPATGPEAALTAAILANERRLRRS
ncbi:LysR family transcriptional regulator [Rhodococcus tukisamuensis]|uniref:DNA-binding transcriptional regulator, LysR family n=1 Tax=Rhodococcus tukisamuensis TaxID=168276 RepID=A0A1G7DZF3_9NOCA|nr:LysR family transcriptional regulator [Rhodococcus tukisamuensis]SDE56475.1 DNA-binding transcriptional regulator, LysR family [Rhodococcus tukisamuensis]